MEKHTKNRGTLFKIHHSFSIHRQITTKFVTLTNCPTCWYSRIIRISTQVLCITKSPLTIPNAPCAGTGSLWISCTVQNRRNKPHLPEKLSKVPVLCLCTMPMVLPPSSAVWTRPWCPCRFPRVLKLKFVAWTWLKLMQTYPSEGGS